jgi:hypothetical protein
VPLASAYPTLLCEAFAVPAFVCPECGQDFESMWQVAVGDSGGYQPVFGGPVVLDVGRCNKTRSWPTRSSQRQAEERQREERCDVPPPLPACGWRGCCGDPY